MKYLQKMSWFERIECNKLVKYQFLFQVKFLGVASDTLAISIYLYLYRLLNLLLKLCKMSFLTIGTVRPVTNVCKFK